MLLIASYIFYHYRYQEETPCDGDKYGIIFLSGNFMVMYLETPEERQEPAFEPNMLNGEVSDWGELMNQHFSDEPTGRKWLEIEQWNK